MNRRRFGGDEPIAHLNPPKRSDPAFSLKNQPNPDKKGENQKNNRIFATAIELGANKKLKKKRRRWNRKKIGQNMK